MSYGPSPAHSLALPALEDGQEVLYNTLDTPRGPQAVKVTLYQG